MPGGALLTNYGVQPVTITHARMAAGPGENEFIVTEFHPVTLQPNETYFVAMNFRPSAAGLRRGVLEILSDEVIAAVNAPAEKESHSREERDRLFFEAMMRVIDRLAPGYEK